MAFNLDEKVLKRLSEGQHTAKLLIWTDDSDEKGDRLSLTWEILTPGYERTLKQAVFPGQLQYVTSCLRNQMGLQDEDVTMKDILNKGYTHQVTLYITYNTYGMNIGLHEPVVEATAEEAQATATEVAM